MKKILFVLLLLFGTRTGNAQMWGVSPQNIMRNATKLGATLESQDTTEDGSLILSFSVKEGLITTFLFEQQRLVAYFVGYNTKFVSPPTPEGYERNEDGKTIWTNREKNEVTARTYHGSWVTDGITPISAKLLLFD